MYKSHRNVANEKASFEINTFLLITAFEENESKANETYLNKIIKVKGLVTSYNEKDKTLTVDKKMFVILTEDNQKIKVNDSITFKGRFLGYDELLEEVKMDQVIIIK